MLVRISPAARVALASLLAGVLAFAATGSAHTSVTGPAPDRWYSFAPYVEVSQWPPPDFNAIRSGAGVRDVTLAFVTAQGGNNCVPTWGGYSAYPASGRAYELAEIRSFRRGGGAVVPSFGGATGAELATVCSSAKSLQAAYAKVVAAYGVDHIDFDIEGADVANFAAAKRRGAALASLQTVAAKAGRKLRVSLTLPVLPSGLSPDAKKVLTDTVRAGVSISMVNGMAMDYGHAAAPNPSGKMGSYAIDAATSVGHQLHSLFPSLGARALASMIGITAMIGINDVSDEVFTAANATQLSKYAAAHHLGMLSMWQLERDKQCPGPTATAQVACSGVSQAPWMFSGLLKR